MQKSDQTEKMAGHQLTKDLYPKKCFTLLSFFACMYKKNYNYENQNSETRMTASQPKPWNKNDR